MTNQLQKKIQNNIKWLTHIGLSVGWQKIIKNRFVVSLIPTEHIILLAGDLLIGDANIANDETCGYYVTALESVAVEQPRLIHAQISTIPTKVTLEKINLSHYKGTVYSCIFNETYEDTLIPFKNRLKRLMS